MYRAATDPAEKERLLLALGYAPGADRLNSTLDFALTPDVRAQVRRRGLQGCNASPGRDAVSPPQQVPLCCGDGSDTPLDPARPRSLVLGPLPLTSQLRCLPVARMSALSL